MIRSQRNPIGHRYVGGKPIPAAVQFHSVEASRVVSEKVRSSKARRIKAIRSLPWCIGIAGKSYVAVCHPSLSSVLQSIVPNVREDSEAYGQAIRLKYPRRSWPEPRSHN